jgi:tRNA A37 threonylcarbamoyladenosine dehydratase
LVTDLDLARESMAAAARGQGKRRSVPGSVSFVPAAAGLILAGEAIKDLIGWEYYNPQGMGDDKGE